MIQRRLYRALGRVPTLKEMAKIEFRALVGAGVQARDAAEMVSMAYEQLLLGGIKPVRNPFM